MQAPETTSRRSSEHGMREASAAPSKTSTGLCEEGRNDSNTYKVSYAPHCSLYTLKCTFGEKSRVPSLTASSLSSCPVHVVVATGRLNNFPAVSTGRGGMAAARRRTRTERGPQCGGRCQPAAENQQPRRREPAAQDQGKSFTQGHQRPHMHCRYIAKPKEPDQYTFCLEDHANLPEKLRTQEIEHVPDVQSLTYWCAYNSHICGVILQKDTLAYRLIETQDQLSQRTEQVRALQLERDEAQTCAQAFYTEVDATFH